MQQEYDFRTAEERKKGVEEEEKAFDEMFNSDEPVYNKYVDFLLDLIPFKWGWKAKYWPSEIRWWAKCKYQKIRYGVSDDDVHSLGYSTALFLLPRLKYFKKKGKTGIPCYFLPDDFHLLEGEAFEAAEQKGIKEMQYALDEMIFAFEYIVDADKFCNIPEILSVKVKRLDLNSERSAEEKQAWKDYMEKANKLNERKENGLMLFAKYYDILWI